MNECGKQVVERVVYNEQKAYRVTETIGSYTKNVQVIVTHYTRNNPIFDYTIENVL
jgi:hypothetical protein